MWENLTMEGGLSVAARVRGLEVGEVLTCGLVLQDDSDELVCVFCGACELCCECSSPGDLGPSQDTRSTMHGRPTRGRSRGVAGRFGFSPANDRPRPHSLLWGCEALSAFLTADPRQTRLSTLRTSTASAERLVQRGRGRRRTLRGAGREA